MFFSPSLLIIIKHIFNSHFSYFSVHLFHNPIVIVIIVIMIMITSVMSAASMSTLTTSSSNREQNLPYVRMFACVVTIIIIITTIITIIILTILTMLATWPSGVMLELFSAFSAVSSAVLTNLILTISICICNLICIGFCRLTQLNTFSPCSAHKPDYTIKKKIRTLEPSCPLRLWYILGPASRVWAFGRLMFEF